MDFRDDLLVLFFLLFSFRVCLCCWGGGGLLPPTPPSVLGFFCLFLSSPPSLCLSTKLTTGTPVTQGTPGTPGTPAPGTPGSVLGPSTVQFRKNSPHNSFQTSRPDLPAKVRGGQEQRQGGLSKGGFCRVQCHGQGNQKYPRILAPAVHLALRAPHPRQAYILQNPPSKSPLFLAPEEDKRATTNVQNGLVFSFDSLLFSEGKA